MCTETMSLSEPWSASERLHFQQRRVARLLVVDNSFPVVDVRCPLGSSWEALLRYGDIPDLLKAILLDQRWNSQATYSVSDEAFATLM